MSSTSAEMTSLKLSFNGEIRRLSVSKTLSYEDLVKTTLRIFPQLVSVQFSWVDDEDDKVVVDSDAELSEALRVMSAEKKGYLRFDVTTKQSESSGISENVPLAEAFGVISHDNVECDNCHMNPIIGSRYKCTVRQNYDLCEACEQKGHDYPTVKIYSPGQAPAAILAVVDDSHGRRGRKANKHRGVTCDVCSSRNFTGCRFKCTVRPDYDLCSICEAAEIQPFAMIKFYSPNQLKSIEVIPAEDMAIGGAVSQSHDKVGKCDSPGKQCENNSTIKHPHIRCNSCGMKPIIGIRFKCSVRPNFNLCATCESKELQKHAMLKMYSSEKVSDCNANAFDNLQIGVSNSLGWLRGTSPRTEKHPVDDKFPRNGGCKRSNWWRHRELEEEKSSGTQDLDMKESNAEKTAMSNSMLSDVTSSTRWSTSSACSALSNVSGINGRSLEELSQSSSSKVKNKVKLMARFVQDVTMPDGTQIAPYAAFHKTWRVRNDGSLDWPEGCNLVTAGGDDLLDPKVDDFSKKFRLPIQPTVSGEEVDITVELHAPGTNGRYVEYFRLQDPQGGLFGQRLWSDIRVTDVDLSSSATLSPWQLVQPDGESMETDVPSDDTQNDSTLLTRGCTVRVHGLKDCPELNGQLAICNQLDESEGKWEIELVDGSAQLILGVDNLMVEEVSYEDQLDMEEEEDVEVETPESEQCTEEKQCLRTEESHEGVEENQQNETSPPLIPERWNVELKVLQDMGFSDLDVLVPLLERHISVPASERHETGSLHEMVEGQHQEEGLQAVVIALLSDP
jgi:hypothetical protein